MEELLIHRNDVDAEYCLIDMDNVIQVSPVQDNE